MYEYVQVDLMKAEDMSVSSIVVSGATVCRADDAVRADTNTETERLAREYPAGTVREVRQP
jgi:hypothetical protein